MLKPKRSWDGLGSAVWLLMVIGALVLVVGLFVGLSKHGIIGREPEGNASAVRVDAESLVRDYDANEVRADGNYKGKALAVRGVVQRVGRDVANKPFAILSGVGIRNVQCVFNSDDELRSLNTGDKIMITGKCTGLMMNVLLVDCAITGR